MPRPFFGSLMWAQPRLFGLRHDRERRADVNLTRAAARVIMRLYLNGGRAAGRVRGDRDSCDDLRVAHRR
jgi:hypothetical protein